MKWLQKGNSDNSSLVMDALDNNTPQVDLDLYKPFPNDLQPFGEAANYNFIGQGDLAMGAGLVETHDNPFNLNS